MIKHNAFIIQAKELTERKAQRQREEVTNHIEFDIFNPVAAILTTVNKPSANIK